MYRVALLLLGALAVTVTGDSDPNCCTAGDRTKIIAQWKEVFHTQDAKFKYGTAGLLLDRVLKDYPDGVALFKNVGIDNPQSGAFKSHLMRIFNAIDMIINLLHEPEALAEALDHLADQHAVREGVKKAHFQSFTEAMFRGLYKLLDHFDGFAWKSCMRPILSKIASKLPE
jgi:hemoglobin-like flavoprotein